MFAAIWMTFPKGILRQVIVAAALWLECISKAEAEGKGEPEARRDNPESRDMKTPPRMKSLKTHPRVERHRNTSQSEEG
jgi:hypothetical protein